MAHNQNSCSCWSRLSQSERLSRKDFIKQCGRTSIGIAMLSSISIGSSVAECINDRDDILKHKQEIIQFQKTCKPAISECVGAGNYERFCQTALSEFDGFASQLPCYEDEMNKQLFMANCPWMLSNYRTLRGEFNLKEKEALEKLRQITNYKHRQKFENPSLFMKIIYPRIAKYDFMRRATLKRFRINTVEKYGWFAEFPESDAYIGVNYVQCGLTDWFRDQEAPEIAPIACEGDYIQFALLKGVKFVRTKTIANGNEICDFRFYQEDA